MKKIAPILIIVATIGFIGYFDSANFFEKQNVIASFPELSDEEVSTNATNEQSSEDDNQIYSLETKLVDVVEDEGYTVEVYREYEVYKDEEGNTIESVPTDNYQYLRYKE